MGVSRPRPVYPGSTVLSTRAVHKRQLLLRPTEKLNQIIEYTTAVLAERYGIELHALCVESSHKHDVATDPDARIVEFQRDLHELITRQVNREYGEFGDLWDGDGPNRVDCTDAETVIDKIVYTMVNPVKDGLVAYGKNWPGIRRCWPAAPKVVRRPDGFFRDQKDGGTWPETATLSFSRPPGFDHLTDDELAAKIREAIDAKEAEYRSEAQREGRRFIGRRPVLRTSRYAYAQSRRQQFGRVPTLAGKTSPRIAAIARLRTFRVEHAEALVAYRAGDRDVEFPYGTWKMRVYYGARCRPPP